MCIADGNGDLISKVADASATQGLTNLTNVIDSLGSFSPDSYVTDLSGNLTEVVNTIRKYAKGQIPDVSGTNYAILQKVADRSQWPTCTSDADFMLDSWVPSNSQDSAYSTIGCQVSSGNVGNELTCPGPTRVAAGNANCKGCMDTTMISTVYATNTTLYSDLLARYTCTQFPEQIDNLYQHYYSVKNAALGPTVTTAGVGTVMGRTLDAQAVIVDNTTYAGVYKNLYAIQSLFTDIKTNLNSIAALTDPTYGMLAGLNCKLFGEDFSTLYKVTCGSFYKNVYLLRLTIGIACWGILFAMCCIVCTGVRHYKHSEREKKVGDAFFKNSFDEGSKRVLNTKH